MVRQEATKLPSSLGCIECIATHGAVPSERNPETSCVTFPHQANEKIPTLIHQKYWQERLRHSLTINSIPGSVPYNWERWHWTIPIHRDSSVSPREMKGLDGTSSIPILKITIQARDGRPQTPSSEANKACVHETYKTVANKETGLNGCEVLTVAMFLRSVLRNQAKKSITQYLPERNVTAYFTSCCLRVQILI